VTGIVILVAIPLTYGSKKIIREAHLKFTTAPLAEQWAQANAWKVINLRVENSEIHVTAFGPKPELKAEKLREALDDAGYADLDLVVDLVTGGTRKLPGIDQPRD
jgi:hypothetical protein